jgi:hypothetical protein
MNFKNVVALALVAVVLLVATPVAAQTYLVETQSPFWAQMNNVHDGTARAEREVAGVRGSH